MIGVGQKIRESRKLKGLSQEELADLAKVNLRTVQRIEANQNEPRGKTLNLLCEVLEINKREPSEEFAKSYYDKAQAFVEQMLATRRGQIGEGEGIDKEVIGNYYNA